MQRWLLTGLLFLSAAAWGCNGDEPLACVEVSTDCTPLYPPTFNNVFDFTITPGCSVAGNSCHAAQGGAGGLILEDRDSAYAALMARDRIIPEDPGCSTSVIRILSDDPKVQMPPGAPLSEEESCAIIQWVADGALR
jgi:hypothetical protein